MKRAYFLCIVIVLLFALIFMLSGCGAISDEAQIRSVINGFSNAVSNQNWDKARGYCVYGSDLYNMVTDLENFIAQSSSLYATIDIDYSFNISNIIITGDYATADGFLTVIITGSGPGGEDQEESGENQTMNLKKVDNSWKIY